MWRGSDADRFSNQYYGRAPRGELLLQDEDSGELRSNAELLAEPRILVREDVFVDPPERRVEVWHDLLAADAALSSVARTRAIAAATASP